jgi:hypothetical protein
MKNKTKTECVNFMNTGTYKKDEPAGTSNGGGNSSTQKTENEEDVEQSY